MNIVAFDPGKTTGVARARITGARTYSIIDAYQISWEDRFSAIKNTLYSADHRPDIVVVEDFRLYPHAAQHLINNSFPAVRVIGIIEAFCYEARIKLEFQTPASRKSTVVPDEDRPLVRQLKHSLDAYLHLRYWVLLNGKRYFASEG